METQLVRGGKRFYIFNSCCVQFSHSPVKVSSLLFLKCVNLKNIHILLVKNGLQKISFIAIIYENLSSCKIVAMLVLSPLFVLIFCTPLCPPAVLRVNWHEMFNPDTSWAPACNLSFMRLITELLPLKPPVIH